MKVEIDDYLDLDDVSYVIDRAAVASVAPLPGKVEKVRNYVFKRPDCLPMLKINK